MSGTGCSDDRQPFGVRLDPPVAAWFVILVALAGVVAGAEYKVTNLGGLPGSPGNWWVQALGINPSGTTVVGLSEGDAGMFAVNFGGGGTSPVDLGTLNGVPFSQAMGVNDSGQIVGWSDVTYTGATYHPFLYSNGHMTDLGGLPGFPNGEALGINNAGQVVGYSFTTGPNGLPGDSHAFLYSGGKMSDLGTLPGEDISSRATAINGKGQVTGFSDGNANRHAFLYSNGTMTDLGGGLNGPEPQAINNNGQIVGIQNEDAFFYSNGKFTDLGGLPGTTTRSTATGINDAGTVVGWTYGPSAAPTDFLGFVSYDDKTLIALNSLISPSSGWSIRSAAAISQNGSIAAYGNFKGGEDQPLLLTPVPNGDANFDGVVNFSDLVLLAQNYGKSGGWAQGDFNRDGKVGFDDLVILAANYGGSQPAITAVPEPGFAAMIAVALAALGRRRTRNSRPSLN